MEIRIHPSSHKLPYLSVKYFLLCITIAVSIAFGGNAAKADTAFSNDVEAINKAAKSVLMLEVYDNKGICIATGSGFVAFNNSTLITNYHVIDEGSYIIGNSDDGDRFRLSKVLCSNKALDIAILSFDDDTNIAPLPLYCGDNLMRGEPVVAIGSPISVTNTVSKGNISALYTDDDIPWIQFTAPISHGSSGGALFNDDGAVIGITSASYTYGEDMNLAVRAVVAQAMYNAWNGVTYTFARAPIASKVDYSTIDSDAIIVKGIDVLSDSAQWTCPDCSNLNTTLFCLQCGKARPEWICQCGQKNISAFCGRCGQSIDELVKLYNAADRKKNAAEYLDAAADFEFLAEFNSGTYETNAGTHAVASDHINECYYQLALQLQKDGDYNRAISYFMLVESAYSDSAVKIQECYYQYAELLLSQGNYDDATAAFQSAGDYKDAASRILEPYYVHGKFLMAEKKYIEAISVFSSCREYADTSTLIKESYYQIGMMNYNDGDYDAALTAFQHSEDYSDAVAMIDQVELKKAVLLGSNGQYQTAIETLGKIKDVTLAAEKLDEYNYLAGKKALEHFEYEQAESYFANAGSYEDAEECLLLAYTTEIKSLVDSEKYDKAYEAYTKAVKAGQVVEDPVLVAPTDESTIALALLQRAKDFGFIKKLAKDEKNYQESYIRENGNRLRPNT